jgi:cell division protein ZapD
MVSIRLMRSDAEGKLKIASDLDAGFELTFCA